MKFTKIEIRSSVSRLSFAILSFDMINDDFDCTLHFASKSNYYGANGPWCTLDEIAHAFSPWIFSTFITIFK